MERELGYRNLSDLSEVPQCVYIALRSPLLRLLCPYQETCCAYSLLVCVHLSQAVKCHGQIRGVLSMPTSTAFMPFVGKVPKVELQHVLRTPLCCLITLFGHVWALSFADLDSVGRWYMHSQRKPVSDLRTEPRSDETQFSSLTINYHLSKSFVVKSWH